MNGKNGGVESGGIVGGNMGGIARGRSGGREALDEDDDEDEDEDDNEQEKGLDCEYPHHRRRHLVGLSPQYWSHSTLLCGDVRGLALADGLDCYSSATTTRTTRTPNVTMVAEACSMVRGGGSNARGRPIGGRKRSRREAGGTAAETDAIAAEATVGDDDDDKDDDDYGCVGSGSGSGSFCVAGENGPERSSGDDGDCGGGVRNVDTPEIDRSEQVRRRHGGSRSRRRCLRFRCSRQCRRRLVPISRVDMLGIVVYVDRKRDRTLYVLDDGTGLIDVIAWEDDVGGGGAYDADADADADGEDDLLALGRGMDLSLSAIDKRGRQGGWGQQQQQQPSRRRGEMGLGGSSVVSVGDVARVRGRIRVASVIDIVPGNVRYSGGIREKEELDVVREIHASSVERSGSDLGGRTDCEALHWLRCVQLGRRMGLDPMTMAAEATIKPPNGCERIEGKRSRSKSDTADEEEEGGCVLGKNKRGDRPVTQIRGGCDKFGGEDDDDDVDVDVDVDAGVARCNNLGNVENIDKEEESIDEVLRRESYNSVRRRGHEPILCGSDVLDLLLGPRYAPLASAESLEEEEDIDVDDGTMAKSRLAGRGGRRYGARGNRCRCGAAVSYKSALLYCHCHATTEVMDPRFRFRDALLEELIRMEEASNSRDGPSAPVETTKTTMATNSMTTTAMKANSTSPPKKSVTFRAGTSQDGKKSTEEGARCSSVLCEPSESASARLVPSLAAVPPPPLRFLYKTLLRIRSLSSVAIDALSEAGRATDSISVRRLFLATFQHLRSDGVLHLEDEDRDEYLLVSFERVLRPYARMLVGLSPHFRCSDGSGDGGGGERDGEEGGGEGMASTIAASFLERSALKANPPAFVRMVPRGRMRAAMKLALGGR